jgi:hypothetical protein
MPLARQARNRLNDAALMIMLGLAIRGDVALTDLHQQFSV